MKFSKKYQEFMQGQDQRKLPGVGLKKLKKILKKCRRRGCPSQSQMAMNQATGQPIANAHVCPQHCQGRPSHPFLVRCWSLYPLLISHDNKEIRPESFNFLVP
ncbi:hypothetical protein SAY87_015927 [Trapa incisa]|uniref:Uncharacterized protein n=1 Tax=Trapa incisa TaxID=236973 RepID=A0AAN7QX14_9MYRT|nr:hypothetical protein SAY87_015927 [Trapa incisa]